MHQDDELDRALMTLHRNTQMVIQRLMRITEARICAGLTQADVAERMGVTEEDVAEIEKRWARGDYPEIRVLKAYARAVEKKIEVRLVDR